MIKTINNIDYYQSESESIQNAQESIIEDFTFFEEWTDKYQYLIELGRNLPELPEQFKKDDYLIEECQSKIWLISHCGDDSKIYFLAASDSALVSGLVALLLKVYSGRTANEVLATQPEFIHAIGLAKHLSPTRNNGLAGVLNHIKCDAKEYLQHSNS